MNEPGQTSFTPAQAPARGEVSSVEADLAQWLFESFRWSDSPEGHAYWEERFWALMGLADWSAPH